MVLKFRLENENKELKASLAEAKREIERLVAVNGGDGFNFPKSEQQGYADQGELEAYLREQARVSAANSKEWAASDPINAAYRNGMWYAYNDVIERMASLFDRLNKLDREARAVIDAYDLPKEDYCGQVHDAIARLRIAAGKKPQ